MIILYRSSSESLVCFVFVFFAKWPLTLFQCHRRLNLHNLQNQSLESVTIEIIINVVIGAFSGEDLKCMARVTVRLQVSDYSQLSDYTVRLQLCRLIRTKYISSCTNHI